jgi:hypothetical protein
MRQRRRHARNTILWGLAGFFALQLGLGLALETGLWRFRDPYYAHKLAPLRRRWDEVQRRRSQHLVVMLGSSRTGNGLKGSCFEEEVSAALGERWSICNLGVPGAGPLVEWINLKRVLAEGVRPDFVLVEVMPLFLAEPPAYETTLIKAERLALADLECLQQCRLTTSATLRQDWLRYWPFPWYAHRFSILSELAPLFVPANLQQTWCAHCDPTGWVALETNTDATPAETEAMLGRVRRQYEPILRDFRLADAGRAALRAILTECQDRGIPTALVLLPEATTFRSWYGDHVKVALREFLTQLQTDFEVPLVDGEAWVPDHGFPDYFHLNTEGADCFTRRLSREVAPLLRGRAATRTASAPAGRPAAPLAAHPTHSAAATGPGAN